MASTLIKSYFFIILFCILSIYNVNSLPISYKATSVELFKNKVLSPSTNAMSDILNLEEPTLSERHFESKDIVKQAYENAKRKQKEADEAVEIARSLKELQKERKSENDDSSTAYQNYQKTPYSHDNSISVKNETVTATNTIIKTVVIVSTQEPTSTVIYGGTTGKPSKQKDEDEVGSSVSDPNSISPTNESHSKPQNTKAKSKSKYKKLVFAMSIVGSIAGIIVISAVIIVAKMKFNKKNRKDIDEESGNSNNDNEYSNNKQNGQTPRTTNPNSDNSNPVESTCTPMANNVFSSSHEHNTSVECNGSNYMVDAYPSAPPAPPSIIMYPSLSSNDKRNSGLSVASVNTSYATPSAPTVKELSKEDCENTHEEYYGNRLTQGGSGLTDIMENGSSANHITRNQLNRAGPGPSIVNVSNIYTSQSARTILQGQPSQSHRNYNIPEFIPPPAYTPSALPNAELVVSPSAPPLYISQQTNYDTDQHNENQEQSQRSV